MKITSVRAIPVLVPVRAFDPKPWIVRTHIDRTIVEIETDAGIIGLGETRCTWPAEIINKRFGPAILGLSPFERGIARRRCLRHAVDYGSPEHLLDATAFAAIEFALWDIAGKHAGLPVFRLIGGPARKHAPFVAYGYPAAPDSGIAERDVPRALAEFAVREIGETGSDTFEFKIGRYEGLALNIDCIHAVREALGPRIDIAIDANMRFSGEEARRLLTATAAARLSNFEEPVVGLAEMERLRASFPVAVSTHCINLDALKPYPLIDAVVPDPYLLGGVEATIAFIHGVEALGKRVWLRSMWELGIGFATLCHLGIALGALDRPSTGFVHYPIDDLILGETWRIRGGGVAVPEAPGWGVELDRAALETYRI